MEIWSYEWKSKQELKQLPNEPRPEMKKKKKKKKEKKRKDEVREREIWISGTRMKIKWY